MRLRLLATAGRSMDLDAIIHHVGVAFNNGQMDVAADRSEAFFGVSAEEFGPNEQKLHGPLLYCITAKRYDVASALINKVYTRMNAFLEEGPGPSGAPEILWAKQGVENKFVFHPSLREIGFNERYTIISRWYCVLKICNAYNLAGLKDGRTVVGVGDLAGQPGLCFCDNRGDYTTLIPDSSFLGSNGYSPERASIEKAWRPYADRRPIAFWRGSSTGRIGGRRKDVPRTKLCLHAQTAPTLLNCAISQIVQADEEDTEDLKNLGVIGPWAETGELVEYKIQIDIDGNTNSWPGYFTKLLTGSPVIKIASEGKYKQWYYDRMEPFVHFIPVDEDMSNLNATVEMLLADDALAERVGRSGRAFAEAMTLDAEIRRCLPDVEKAMLRG